MEEKIREILESDLEVVAERAEEPTNGYIYGISKGAHRLAAIIGTGLSETECRALWDMIQFYRTCAGIPDRADDMRLVLYPVLNRNGFDCSTGKYTTPPEKG